MPHRHNPSEAKSHFTGLVTVPNNEGEEDERAGHVARMGRRGTNIGCWWESQRKKGHEENQDVGGWIILEWML
jgi:hypothetical protein